MQLVTMDGAAQRGVLRDLVADDEQLHVPQVGTLVPQEMKRIDQPFEILVGLDIARVKDERGRELVALADALHVLSGRCLPVALVDGVIDHIDARLGHAEVAQDVAL